MYLFRSSKHTFKSITSVTMFWPNHHINKWVLGGCFRGFLHVVAAVISSCLTFHWYLHWHASCWGPQVHFTISSAYGKSRLAWVPLKWVNGTQLLQDYEQLKLLNVPDPDGIRSIIYQNGNSANTVRKEMQYAVSFQYLTLHVFIEIPDLYYHLHHWQHGAQCIKLCITSRTD